MHGSMPEYINSTCRDFKVSFVHEVRHSLRVPQCGKLANKKAHIGKWAFCLLAPLRRLSSNVYLHPQQVKFEKPLKLSNALPFPEILAESSQIIRYLDLTPMRLKDLLVSRRSISSIQQVLDEAWSMQSIADAHEGSKGDVWTSVLKQFIDYGEIRRGIFSALP